MGWLYSQGGCQCMAGYQADRSSQEACVACDIGSYKPFPGEELCDICPAYSKALFPGSVECRCNNGYYRALSDPRNVSCPRPPSSPRNLTLTPRAAEQTPPTGSTAETAAQRSGSTRARRHSSRPSSPWRA